MSVVKQMDISKSIAWIIILGLVILIKLRTEGCTFPDSWSGTWYSSRRGDLVINTTTIDSINTTLTGPLQYTCFLHTGDTYIIRSELFTLHNALHRVYFCLRIWEVTPASLAYYHLTKQNAQAYNERLKAYPAISSVTKLDLCDDTPDPTSWEMLVNQGLALAAATDCPNSIRGVYNYTVTLSSTTTCGLGNSSLDVCLNTTTPTVNMSLCGTSIAYSAGGLLQCVFSQVIGSYTYTILLNLDAMTDEMTTYRFTCLVSNVAGDYTYVSQYPETCHSSQTPTSVPAGGGTLIMLPSETCPSRATGLIVSSATYIRMLFVSLFLLLSNI